MRHEADIYHAAFSPDGRHLVTSSQDATARAELLTCQHRDTEGRTVPLTPVELRERWEEAGITR